PVLTQVHTARVGVLLARRPGLCGWWRRDCPTGGGGRQGGRVVGLAAAHRRGFVPPMNAMGFAWRSLVRQPARASLGVIGVAAVGALLFDMLMLSNGLVTSMRSLLERTGFDLRVSATDEMPGQGPLIPDAIAATRTIS